MQEKWKRIALRAISLALLVGLLLGAIHALRSAERRRPENALDGNQMPIHLAQMLPGTDGSQTGSDTEPEETDVQESEPPETEEPEETQEPQPSPDDTEQPDADADQKNDTTKPDGDDGAGEKPDASPTEPHIVTNLESRAWTPAELQDDTLHFYAYAAGQGALSLRVYWKETTSTANNGTRMTPENGQDYALPMRLNTEYQITVYLYQDGKQYGQAAVFYVSYRAALADEASPVVGAYPPTITTNRDGITEPVSQQRFTLVVSARTNENAPEGNRPIYENHLKVWLDGELLTQPTGSAVSGYEYVLNLYPPQTGDTRVYTVKILAWDEWGNSRLRTLEIVYETVSDGDLIGYATIRVDATTLGLGIMDEGVYEIRQGETAAQSVLCFLEECGYENVEYNGTAKKNGGFYLLRIYRGDLLHGAQIDERLWTLVLRDGISLTGTPDRDSLGEHDYTWGAGWMFDVDGYYPGKGLSEWSLEDGDVLTLRFTLAWGKDINGYGNSGGQYGALSSYCGIWRDGSYTPMEHAYQETERVEPTEAEDGYVILTCSKCGETTRELLPCPTPEPDESAEPIEPVEPDEPIDPTQDAAPRRSPARKKRKERLHEAY